MLQLLILCSIYFSNFFTLAIVPRYLKIIIRDTSKSANVCELASKLNLSLFNIDFGLPHFQDSHFQI